MGFMDGTANLDGTDAALMDRHVWVGAGDGEPAWAVGGSYQVVRIIRMFVEFWDRTAARRAGGADRPAQANGAPLDGDRETDVPDYAADPEGKRTPLDAHIRLANPRTRETEDEPHPAPRLQLLARFRRRRSARPGPGIRVATNAASS